MALSDDELAAVLNQEIARAAGYESDTLSTMRSESLAYYNGVMPDAAVGRSQIVSLDLADGIHALMAQVQPVIKTTQIEFEAAGEGDEAQAQSESDFVRVMIERANGYQVIFSSTHDALLSANGWIYAGVDTEVVVTEDKYPADIPEEALAAFEELYAPAKVVSISQDATQTVVRVEQEKKRLVVESIPPEDMLFSESGASYDVATVRFVARKRLYTAAQLSAMGVSDADIESIPDSNQSNAGNPRLGKMATSVNPAVQAAEALKLIYCCYLRVQEGGSNKVQLRHVWIGGNVIVKNDPAEYVAFICGSALPMPHRIVGISLYDLLRSVQSGKTQILRQYMDNLSVMNGSRLAVVDGQVNIADLEDGRINGYVRTRSRDAILPLPATDIGPQALAGMNYLDALRTQRIGSAVDFNEVQAQLMGTSATAAAGQLAKVEQMSGWFAQNIVQTIVLPLFRLVHLILRTELAAPVTAKIAGKWRETNTGQWPARDVTNVSMGMTTVEKAERLQALTGVIGKLESLLAAGGGGIITDQSKLYAAMADWIRSSNLGGADQYLIDPASDEARAAGQQAQADKQAAAAQALQIKAAEAKLLHHFEMVKQDAELQYKRWSDQLNADIEEAKLTQSGIVSLKQIQAAEKSEDQAEDTAEAPEPGEGVEND